MPRLFDSLNRNQTGVRKSSTGGHQGKPLNNYFPWCKLTLLSKLLQLLALSLATMEGFPDGVPIHSQCFGDFVDGHT